MFSSLRIKASNELVKFYHSSVVIVLSYERNIYVLDRYIRETKNRKSNYY